MHVANSCRRLLQASYDSTRAGRDKCRPTHITRLATGEPLYQSNSHRPEATSLTASATVVEQGIFEGVFSPLSFPKFAALTLLSVAYARYAAAYGRKF